jgi:DNA-directed RNA polymerase subunit alpha
VGRPEVSAAGQGGGALRDKLGRLIDDFGLSVRSLNSLKNSNIRTLGDLVTYTEDELLKVKNVGEKALKEIADLLRAQDLNFGMRFEEADGDLQVAFAGLPPSPRSGLDSVEEG